MTRALLLLAALTMTTLLPAKAQGDDTPAPSPQVDPSQDFPGQNPPAPPPAQDAYDVPQTPADAPADVPVWAGTFSDWSIQVDLRPALGGFEGTVLIAGTPYQARGEVREEASTTSLVGTLAGGAREFDFSATMEGPDTMVFTHSGVTHRLPRVVVEARPQGGTAEALNVRPGQTYVYDVEGGTQMRWIVREVTSKEVSYDIQAYTDTGSGLQPEGEPVPAELPFVPLSPERDMPRERVDVPGGSFECVVFESGDTTSWIAVDGDFTTFPGCVRSMKAGAVIMELVAVEEP